MALKIKIDKPQTTEDRLNMLEKKLQTLQQNLEEIKKKVVKPYGPVS